MICMADMALIMQATLIFELGFRVLWKQLSRVCWCCCGSTWLSTTAGGGSLCFFDGGNHCLPLPVSLFWFHPINGEMHALHDDIAVLVRMRYAVGAPIDVDIVDGVVRMNEVVVPFSSVV